MELRKLTPRQQTDMDYDGALPEDEDVAEDDMDLLFTDVDDMDWFLDEEDDVELT